MRRRLVFIDDDETELTAFREIVGEAYDYTAVHWPAESNRLSKCPAPDIFVSDLYLPGPAGDITPTPNQRAAARKRSQLVGQLFKGLYPDPPRDPDTLLGDKARLKKTMGAIVEAFKLLELQWSALGQSPEHGIALLQEVKSRHPSVPFVFYSRKITPEDVIRVLQAGATDAIRKGALDSEEVLKRLASAQQMCGREDLRNISAVG